MSQQGLEARVEALEAERDIRRLVGRYSRACDPIDPDRIASLFTEDATWSSRTTDGSIEFGAASGREAIHRTFVALGDAIAAPTAHYCLQDDIMLDPAAGTASASWYTLVLTRGRSEEHPGGDPTLLLGTYEHEYRRETDGWRFSRVDTYIEFMASVSGLPGQLPPRRPTEV